MLRLSYYLCSPIYGTDGCWLSIVYNHYNLLTNGDNAKKSGNISQAFYSYAKAEEIIGRNFDVYTEEDRLQKLKKIKEFYDANGYIYECRKIRKDILLLTKQTFGSDSVELAKCYHDIGYAYERYWYYGLMLKAMERSCEILQRCDKNTKEFINACAFIYISLGYAYLKNNKEEDAKKWFEEAEKWYDTNKEQLDKKEKAFMLNGLYRYYDLQKDGERAIQTLDEALVLRKEIFTDGTGSSANHLVNTYSNKIKIYLENDKLKEARDVYEAFKQEQDIWNRLEDHPGAKRRILEAYGDILEAEGENIMAYNEYKHAVQFRKYLHFTYDTITVEIYFKIANCLINAVGKKEMVKEEEKEIELERAMEYIIQNYAIYKKIIGENSENKLKDISNNLYNLGERLSLSKERIDERLSVQEELLEFRHDERMDKREEELIQFFEL